ncbi:hypothetical protein BCR37DRAFT_62858 [Protomyces lactucae-debilis]|uniref:Uncharacterized protein n=1 Tax=Protomyces lactucae-debilis TaxID=2754530 RepID=A0A1Y2FAS0_PROLT|nr:uncharacterized protein BCR37DRAFT_62858 [Protomyces lactucae-debilis]ORY81022.1 hypothetical protein BCR37DRAFT_62858 [Protomyces lactucae-debilis]
MKPFIPATLCFLSMTIKFAGAVPVERTQRPSQVHARRSLQDWLSWLQVSVGDLVHVGVGETSDANTQTKTPAIVSVKAPFTDIQVKDKRDAPDLLYWFPQENSGDQDSWDTEEQSNLSLEQEQAPTSGAVQE